MVYGGRELKTIKVFIALVLTLVLIVTGVVYAAPFSASSVKAIGGTGYQFVAAPSSSPLAIAWKMTGGQVDGVNITWTPDLNGSFKIKVKVKVNKDSPNPQANGNVTVAGTQDVEQTDLVPISPAIDAVDISTVAFAIVEK